MKYFLSETGLEPICLTNDELGLKLTEGRNPNRDIMNRLVDALEESCIIIKHFDCSMEDLCYLCESTSEGSANIRNLRQHANNIYDVFGSITVVTSIRGYANNFYAHTLNVRREMLEPMIRKRLIDDFLLDNP